MSCCNQPNYAPVIDPCNVPCTPTDNVCYSGPNLPCTGIHACDTVTVSLQKIDEEVCDLQSQITALQTLVNSLTTTTTTTSTSSTTTTTTTIACPSCEFYSVTNSTVSSVDITYYACGGVFVQTSVAGPSTIYICACTGTVVVPPVPGVSLANVGACPTTTTTTTTTCPSPTYLIIENVTTTGGFGITSMSVNGVPVTYDIGDNFTIAPGQGGSFLTSEIGTVTVEICYTSYSGPTKNISLIDCATPSVTQCCPQSPAVLDPAGGCCTFTNVQIDCGCTVIISASDGACATTTTTTTLI